MRKFETTCYSITEMKLLFPAAYETIIERFTSINTQYMDWSEFLLEDFTEMIERCGFSDVHIGFSGFGSQGDGAYFTGTYNNSGISREKLLDYCPADEEFIDFYDSLSLILAEWSQAGFKLCHKGNYSHECGAYIDYVECFDELGNTVDYEGYIESKILAACREIMTIMYSRFEATYYELQSESEIYETLLANEYEFTIDGGKVRG